MSRLVEAHVAIADLREAKLACRRCAGAQIGKAAQAIGVQYSALHQAEGAGPRPRHALQKSAAIDSILVVIVQNLILVFCRHLVLLKSLSLLYTERREVRFYARVPAPLWDVFRSSRPRGTGAYSNRRFFFICPRNDPLGNKIASQAVPSMNAGGEGEGLDVLDPQERVRFEQLVLPHVDAAFNLSRWLLHGRADAEDVAQEATLRALRFFRGFHGGDARAWLLQIVRNTCYTWLEKNRSVDLS